MKPEEEKDDNLERLIDSVLSGRQERKLIREILVKSYKIGFAKGKNSTLKELSKVDTIADVERKYQQEHARVIELTAEVNAKLNYIQNLQSDIDILKGDKRDLKDKLNAIKDIL